jgi:triacylglycerol lipase
MRRIRTAVLAVALVAAGAVGCTKPDNEAASSAPVEAQAVGMTVVLVHGFTAEALPNWAVMAPGLTAAGFRTVTFRYSSLTIGAELAATQLGTLVQSLTRNGQKVALLGHSEGGLVTKTCIIFKGCNGKVSHWFNISGVNNGTAISAGLPGNALGDMGITSVLVNRLKAANGQFRSQGIKCHVAYTLTDGLVYPPTASLEPGLGCGSTNVAGSTHFTIIMDPRTVAAAAALFRR